jgi:hypothetical protein
MRSIQSMLSFVAVLALLITPATYFAQRLARARQCEAER